MERPPREKMRPFRQNCPICGEDLKGSRMKRGITFCVLFFAAACCSSAMAGQISDIELIDGGVLTGRIVSQQDGVYVIRTKALGEVTVAEEKIRVIRIKHGPSSENAVTGVPASPQPQEIRDIQKSITENEAIMQKVLSLQSNPQMQAILQDPELLKAVETGNFAELLSNPKFLKLMQSPEIMEIQKEIPPSEGGGR